MKYQIVAGAMASAVALVLSGCGQTLEPAKVCSDPDTIKEIGSLIEDSVMKDINSTDHDAVKAALDALGMDKVVSLQLITMSALNKDTKEITCSSQAHVNLSPEAAKLLSGPVTDNAGLIALQAAASARGFKDGSLELPVTYSRQPTADGKSFVFTLQQPQDITVAVMVAGELQAAAKLMASAPPAAPASDEPPPGSQHADPDPAASESDQPASSAPPT